ncbi:SIMPL domain-containing protein [Crenobacter sp. SG2305]|uniref:SIMPL domain-containing protein n=1 Tax=Crenobacter oryzisoli TaxID=3056844 RepID=UPI0025AAD577|nr:SIMPL domain-containing protein [Crenobacter sp. SG2305]MDN0081503.1 SIMPL domain-containing protein [Crenobacter sp. SG2305]
MRTLYPVLLTAALLAPVYAVAAEATVVSLSGQAQREVDNDETSVVLYAQENNSSPARLADSLNRTLKRALADASVVKAVEASSGLANTWPHYDKNGKINGWQGRSEIRMKSRDSAALAELTGKLQSYLQLERVSFSVSDAVRRQTEATLIPEAIRELNSRASAVGKAIGKPALTIKELNIGESRDIGPRPMMAMAKFAGADAAPEQVTAPSWEAGKSTISVQVSGKVELR